MARRKDGFNEAELIFGAIGLAFLVFYYALRVSWALISVVAVCVIWAVDAMERRQLSQRKVVARRHG